MSRYRKPLCITLAALLALGAGAAGGVLAINAHVRAQAAPYFVAAETAPVCDAILVLGSMVYRGGTPSPILTDRLEHGLALYRAGKAPKLLVSGDHGTAEYDEANAMRDWLVARGVPPEDVFMDHAGFNTYDSMYRARDVFAVKTMLVVTQEFHMSRSLYIARALGLEAYGVAAPDLALYNMRYNNLREALARVKSFLETDVLHRKPKYLGDVIPISGDGRATEG
ncbi:MAG: hypothetical protein ABT01_02815 [Clostridium sp. SCN 57-10]|nr:MAG: hypothetical protein ABT01_02815 [Clostridium sp. SCN 57-10]